MSCVPEWLPSVVLLSDCGGSWDHYVDAVYSVFRRDFIESQPQLRGLWVRCQRDPKYDGKEAAFWHCISEGFDEQSRKPDLRRCERIGWPRAIIEHTDELTVDVWQTRSRRQDRTCLWFNEEYLVVLARRRRIWHLITAYPTDREHTRRKLRRDMKRARNG